MPILILMRHANAEPGNSNLKDFDRPLSQLGWAEAKVTTNMLKAASLGINQVYCSPARRTKETLEAVSQIIPLSDQIIEFDPRLYSGDVSAYQSLLSATNVDAVIMVIGHNPMVERFAFESVKSGDKAKLTRLKFGFPTAAIAIIEMDKGQLLNFFTAN